MGQNKNVIIAVVVTVVVMLGLGAGGVFGYAQMHKKTIMNNGAASINESVDAASNGTQAVGSQSSISNLSVSDSSSQQAQNLGQLSGSTTTGAQGSSNGSNTSSSSGQTIDPSTFSQYEQYKDKTSALFGDIQVGSGKEVGQNSKVAVLYKGWLTNGQMFDQSRTGSDGKIQPFVFTMGAHEVISGWEQGVYGMKVGGSRLIIVPPAVGYGNTPTGSIPANSLLVFQVQVLDVQ